MLLFKNLNICTQNFGFLSDFFVKGQGSNQGCNISPFCFLLCGEIMARKIKQNVNIKGLSIGNTKVLLSQFADDTTLYLSYDALTFKAVFDTFTRIEANTGLTISYEKTVVYPIGSLAGSNAKIYTAKQVDWTNEPINMLGVRINNNYECVDDFDKTVEKMEKVLNSWVHRKLTLMGKVLAVNTLCESLFVYKMSVLPNIDMVTEGKINIILSTYLWGQKRARIARDTLVQSKGSGGLRLFDMHRKQTSLKLAWVPIIKLF